ncbi:MAG: hypothetical protein JNL96_09965, partial [Planctomycetaceae bacterium]|nr:hypothetical protein [Planctomycetales bacterium]MBL9091539.1 hypothetical protein [Planctomycetaceae bacterium]
TEGKGELIPARLYDVVTTLAVERLVVEIMRQLGSAQAQPAKRRAA